MPTTLGQLHRLDPRTVWPNEARDFTPWLASNIDKLSQVLGMDLEVVETEASVGEFSVDILAKDLSSARSVVIENQYGTTDHNHLGKLLTYASGIDAYALVWIAESVRDEHRQALEWLNERTDVDTMLFAIELEVLQINDSPPAPNLKTVVVPNKWQKTTRGGTPLQPSPRAEAYRRYFQVLIDELREIHSFTRAKVAFPQNWFLFASGVSGVGYGASFAQGGRARVELYIDRRQTDENKKLFAWLESKKQEIEAAIGMPLEWERLEDRRACRIALYRQGTIDEDDQTLTEIRSWQISYLLMFKKVLGPLLKRAPKNAAT